VAEVVKMIVEDEMIYQKDAKWRTDSTDKFRIPATIQDVVINRLEALDAVPRKTLKFAAVIGVEFSFDVLLKIVKKDEDGLLDDIEELLRSELIKEIPHSAYDRYKFNSSVVQEVLYSSHNRRRLKLLHEKIARAIEKIYHHQLEEKTEILAYHYFRGKDMENAIKYLLKRAEKAESAYDYTVALESYAKAIKSAQRLNDPKKLIQIYLKRGNLYRKQADYELALEDLQQVKDLSEEIDDNQMRGIALSDMGAIYTDLNNLKKAKIYLDQAYEIFKELDDALNLIGVSNHIAVMNFYEGDIRLAMENFKKTVELCKHHQNTERLADLYGNIGACYMKVGDYDNALKYYDRVLEMADESDFPDYVNALAYNNKGQIYRYRQNYPNSILYYRKALELNRKIKNRQWESFNLYNLSEVYVDIGDYEKAIACVRESLEIEKRINNKVNIIDCLTLLAHDHILQKKLEKAEECLMEASKILKGIDYPFGKMQVYAEYGFLRHAREDYNIRDQYFEKAISINPKDGIYEITKYLCRIGEIEEAKKYLQMAIDQQIKITRFSESDKAFNDAIKDPEFWELLRQVFDYDPTF
jgi:tetratricopeptide (TPR) repeat protein